MQLWHQTKWPDEIIIVDNASSVSCRDLCSRAEALFPTVTITYLDPGENIGPAGSMAIGMQHVLKRGTGGDWIVRCDDDSSLSNSDYLEATQEQAEQLAARDPRLGGVGRSGAMFDRRKGILIKPDPSTGEGPVAVDYLATGMFPFFSVRAVREVGVFRGDLFFGYSELEYGLRLRLAGFNLYRRKPPGYCDQPRVKSQQAPRTRLGIPSWRRYYSLRNLLVIARTYGGWWVTVKVIAKRVVAKPLLHLFFSPRASLAHLRVGGMAVRDALLGHMGRTVEPTLYSGELDTRRTASGL